MSYLREDTMAEKSAGRDRILLMDDDRCVRETLGKMLEFLGYTISAARNGEEAIALFQRAEEQGAPFSFAILDLIIDNGMGGRETAGELRKLKPDLPILAISGYSDDPALASPQAYQFDGSIGKPFLASKMVAELHHHLRRPASGIF
jgi:CheY-like chemotaxis protein